MATLTDRYVIALGRAVPPARREEVERVTRSTIESEIVRRGGGAAVEREVLEEMGDPREIAARVDPHQHRVVGDRHFSAYTRVLRDAALVVVPTVAALGALVESSVDGGRIGVAAASAGLQALIAVVVAVTLGFLVARLVPDRPWSLDDLPDDDAPRRVAFSDVVLQGIVIVLGMGIAVWQQVWPPVTAPDGTDVPFLQPGLWDLWIWVFFGLLLGSLLVLSAAYRRGRWSMPLAVANLALDLGIFVLVVWLAAADRILNPPAQMAMAERLGRDVLWEVPTPVLAVVLGVALAVDAAGPLRSARR